MHSLLAATTLPVPSDYRAGNVSMWLFTLWAGGFALLVLPYVLYRLRQYGDTVLYAILAALVLAWPRGLGFGSAVSG